MLFPRKKKKLPQSFQYTHAQATQTSPTGDQVELEKRYALCVKPHPPSYRTMLKYGDVAG